MSECDQDAITDAAFAHLREIHTLDTSNCNQAGITAATIAHLRGNRLLRMRGCNFDVIRAARDSGHNLAGLSESFFAARSRFRLSVVWQA